MANTNHGGKSTVGLKNFRLAPVTKDDETEVTYGDMMLVAGAIDASITPNDADPDVQYADDIEYDVLNPDPDVTFRIQMASLPLAVQSAILGGTLDTNGVLISKAGDQTPYYAVGFESEKSDKTGRKVWLYKCRAHPITENFGTKEGSTINRQTGEVEFTAIKRTHDDAWKAVCDSSESASATVYPTFLDTVYAS